MEANKIFSKLKIKNYNNELEKIIEKKNFSSDVKNLLLSMLYKIENAYQDYMTVKRITLPKNDFIMQILNIIEERCFEIEFFNPEEEKEIFIDSKEGKIICYPNEKSLLSAILYMQEKQIQVDAKYDYVTDVVQQMINSGSNMNQVEVLRDFNGWSWDIVIKEIDDITYNLLYQNLLLLEENKLINRDIIKLKANKTCSAFYELLYKSAIIRKIEKDENERDKLLKIRNKKMEELEQFHHKKEFIESITVKKKNCAIEIEKIDKIINDKELIRKEYIRRNEKLPNKEKIFSISYLADILEKEREGYLNQIKECNKILDPREFVKEKDKIEDEVNFLQSLSIESIQNQEKNLAELCKECLKCIKYKIEKVEEKNDIIDWIYKIRYYRNIPFNEEIYLKDVKILEEEFKDIIKLLIEKAQNNKIWDIFTEDENIAYYIIKELLDSKMINFENVSIECKYEKGKLYADYYDSDILEMKSEFKIEDVRIKKKIKLFL